MPPNWTFAMRFPSRSSVSRILPGTAKHIYSDLFILQTVEIYVKRDDRDPELVDEDPAGIADSGAGPARRRQNSGDAGNRNRRVARSRGRSGEIRAARGIGDSRRMRSVV